MRHIKTFCDNYDIEHGGKAWWLSLPTTSQQQQYKVKATNGITTYNPQVIFDNYEDAEEYANSHTSDFWEYYVEEV